MIVLAAIVVALLFGVRNARGVFILYFIGGAIVPYAQFILGGEISPFLGPFLSPHETVPAAALLSTAFLVSIVSSVVVAKPANLNVAPKSINPARLEFLALSSIVFFIFYMLISVAFAGSIENALLSSYMRVRTNSSLANIRSIFFWGNVVFTTFAFYGFLFNRPKRRTRYLIYISLLLSALLSLTDGGRAILILFVLSLFASYILRASSRKIMMFSLVSAGVIGFTSYVMLSLRYMAQGAKVISEGSISKAEAFNGLAFIDHFQISIQYAKDVGFNFGSFYLNSIFSILPRDIFPWKAVPLSAQMRGYLYGDETGGVPPGLFGEAYIAAGTFGVILVSFLYGRLLLSTVILCRRAVVANCPVRFAAAGIMVPLIGFTLVRGGLDIGVLRVGLPFFWTLVAILLSTKRRSPASQGNPAIDGAPSSKATFRAPPRPEPPR